MKKNNIINLILKCFILTLYLPLFFSACRLEGDIDDLRRNPWEEPGARLSAPQALTVTAGDAFLSVSWTFVEEAQSYEIYISTSNEPPEVPEKRISGTTTVFNPLENKIKYYIWVKAVNETESSDFSSRGYGTPWPDDEIPETPGLPVIIPGMNQLTVTWEEAGGASYYEVYINTSFIRPAMPEATTIRKSAAIKNLENDVIYYLWVRAGNEAGKSDYSLPEAGTPKIPTVVPSAPLRPVLKAGSHELIVSWQETELTESYEVWYGISNNSSQAVKFAGDYKDTEIVITDLVNETTYYIWIKAKNLVGTSEFSPAANEKPSALTALPITPDAPTVIAGSRILTVTWPQAEGALAYEMWSGTSNNPLSALKHGADISSTSITLTGLENDITYYIWLKSRNNIGISDLSPVSNGTPSAFASAPPAPSNAPAIAAGSGQLTVNWTSVEGAESYEVWAGTTTNSTAAVKRGSDVTGNSSVITSLTNGTAHYVWIKAKNSVGTSGFSPAASGTPSSFTVEPLAPLTPNVTVRSLSANIAWTAAEGALSYEIYTNTENNSATASKYGNDISTLSATISGLSNGTQYFIWLKAKNNIGTSAFNQAATVIPMDNASIPSLTAGNNQISVSWAGLAGANQYEIFVGTGVNPGQTAAQTVNAPVTTATITGLTNGTTYNVWVRGKNSTGTGMISSFASAKPIGNMGTVSVTTGTNGQLVLSWTAVAGADQYEVFQSTSNSMPGTPSQTVSAVTATISGLTNGTVYYFWARPKNANGNGSASTSASGKPLGTPGAPIITPEFRELSLTWTAVAGADQYEVYYGIGNASSLAVTVSGTSTIITGLIGGTIYHIRLRAKNTTGVSDFGPSVSGAPNDMQSPGLYRGEIKIGNQNLSMALNYISSNANNGDNYKIILGGNETITSGNLDYAGKIININLQGYMNEKIITRNSNGSLFTIRAGVTLTLDSNITLLGRDNNDIALINILQSGNLIINDNSKIKGNTCTGSLSGGGLHVRGTLLMNGGEISGNTANTGGGGGIFMNGGEIKNNYSNYDGGGGIYLINNSSFTMNGGKIVGNQSHAKAIIGSSGGGGISVNGGSIAYINNGEIKGNKSTEGGGIYISNGNVTMYGGIINGNIAGLGGGVYIAYGVFKKLSVNHNNYSGIIHGSEAVGNDADGIPLRNDSSRGHSVSDHNYGRMRNTTAWETDHIDTSTGRGLSANGVAPFGQ